MCQGGMGVWGALVCVWGGGCIVSRVGTLTIPSAGLPTTADAKSSSYTTHTNPIHPFACALHTRELDALAAGEVDEVDLAGAAPRVLKDGSPGGACLNIAAGNLQKNAEAEYQNYNSQNVNSCTYSSPSLLRRIHERVGNTMSPTTCAPLHKIDYRWEEDEEGSLSTFFFIQPPAGKWQP